MERFVQDTVGHESEQYRLSGTCIEKVPQQSCRELFHVDGFSSCMGQGRLLPVNPSSAIRLKFGKQSKQQVRNDCELESAGVCC